MDLHKLPPELAASAEALPELVANMETHVPYGAALLARTGGLQVVVDHREQRVSEIPLSQGFVFTAWNGRWFEEVAGTELAARPMLALAQQLAKTVEVFPSAEAIDPGPERTAHFSTPCAKDPAALSSKDKLEMCRDLHSRASKLDPRIVNVHVRYLETWDSKAFANRAKRLSQN
ncbi:MAG: hypothetical protein JSW37_11480, partial [Anaerolineales bacterium]